jgi:hypothetical protein
MGINRIILEVICENHPAIKLYQKCGFRFIRHLKSYEIPFDQIKETESLYPPLPHAILCEPGSLPISLEKALEGLPWQRDWNTLSKMKNEMELFSVRCKNGMTMWMAYWQKTILFMYVDPGSGSFRKEIPGTIGTGSLQVFERYAEQFTRHSELLRLQNIPVDMDMCVLSLLKKATESEPILYFNNITDDELFFTCNQSLGFKNYINQYEMELLI